MRSLSGLLVAWVAFASVAADFKDEDPNVFPKDGPRAKGLPKMMWKDAKRVPPKGRECNRGAGSVQQKRPGAGAPRASDVISRPKPRPSPGT
jgi:hypothetical protein